MSSSKMRYYTPSRDIKKSPYSLTLKFINTGRSSLQSLKLKTICANAQNMLFDANANSDSGNSPLSSLDESRMFPYIKRETFIKESPLILREELKNIKQSISASQSNYFRKMIEMPERKRFEKTLILDLDETLIHSSYTGICDHHLQGIPNIDFSVRPYARELLEYASNNFELVIFTASQKSYADRILNFLDPNNEFISMRIYREHCIRTEKGFIKDLRIFSGRSMKNLILVDNTLLSFAFQLDNGIPISSWYGDKNDNELFKLINFLKIIKEAPDVRDQLKSTFILSML
ncbi:hypothetical protein SteCoe_38454 [Stentor coeruleus]|uniref:FCP1 homology domain-containing protein n=1 Tax=Stentor coeruleus TaxID=5963 RepID=A0A1R2ALP1_9CILI|nr:hypothetical protein SteCoe_38454 [Stentor coeruleus]